MVIVTQQCILWGCLDQLVCSSRPSDHATSTNIGTYRAYAGAARRGGGAPSRSTDSICYLDTLRNSWLIVNTLVRFGLVERWNLAQPAQGIHPICTLSCSAQLQRPGEQCSVPLTKVESLASTHGRPMSNVSHIGMKMVEKWGFKCHMILIIAVWADNDNCRLEIIIFLQQI